MHHILLHTKVCYELTCPIFLILSGRHQYSAISQVALPLHPKIIDQYQLEHSLQTTDWWWPPIGRQFVDFFNIDPAIELKKTCDHPKVVEICLEDLWILDNLLLVIALFFHVQKRGDLILLKFVRITNLCLILWMAKGFRVTAFQLDLCWQPCWIIMLGFEAFQHFQNRLPFLFFLVR